MADLIASGATRLRGRLLLSESMARHVSWRAGGLADRVYAPADIDDLGVFLRGLASDEPLCFAGLGSNLLVRDGGYRGTVILMHSSHAAIRAEGAVMHASAGAACPKMARLAAVQNLEGAEFLAGVPGTIGGALAMNAGCHGSQTWEFVRSVSTIDRTGRLRDRTPADFEIAYRHVALRGEARLGEDEWFVGARMAFTPGDGARARRRIRELLARRIATQPLGLPNAGSVFRNPEGDHAARLIEACGLKGAAMGGALISQKHANFIVNPGGLALAADIEALIAHARNVVRAKFGVDLVPEVRIVGEAAGRIDANCIVAQAGKS
ncbi:MAG: UDP-N-acetylmuramate dehydrogenase [Betaproteobacteria bacterium]|nr:UDP-N-acetylmuramate dehydrogenase [Betaproteobacteria bacterium]